MILACISIILAIATLLILLFVTDLIASRTTLFVCQRTWKNLTKDTCLLHIKKWRSILMWLQLLIFLTIIGLFAYCLIAVPQLKIPLYAAFLSIVATEIPTEIRKAMKQYYTNTYAETCITSA